MPEHLNTQEEIDAAFPDDSQYGTSLFGRIYRWYQKKTKTWFCFSYRCTEWWAKWRRVPKVLFAIKGKGLWRYESGRSEFASCRLIWIASRESYLSRIQYYTRWHFSIQWPLLVSFHVYFKAKDVPVYGEILPDTDNKLLFFYWNHFDADLVYWMFTSIFIGLGWK